MEKRAPLFLQILKIVTSPVGIKDGENNGFADDNFYKFTCSVYWVVGY